MKRKLENIKHIAKALAADIQMNRAAKSITIQALETISASVDGVLAEMKQNADSIEWADEAGKPNFYKRRSSKKTIVAACEYHLATGASLKECERLYGLGNDTLRCTTAVEYLYGKQESERRKNKRKAKKKDSYIYEVDGFLTARGVGVHIGKTKEQVDGLLERARNGKSMFPLPFGKKHVGRSVPSNVWRKEDIQAYKELNQD